MDNLAKKLINDHRNPVVKVDLPPTKLFLKSSTQEDTEFIEKYQSNLENILNYERADRRCARSLATWLPEDKLAKLTKSVKTQNNFGFGDKNGMYLYLEETLFLMETNRLEVTVNGAPLSIQEGYDLLLKNCECDLVKYRVYKQLALLGYRLIRYSELQRRLSKINEHDVSKNKNSGEINNYCRRKRVSKTESECVAKKVKMCSETEDLNLQMKSEGSETITELQYVRDIFDKLRETAPKEYDCPVTDDLAPQYCIFLPNNKSRCDYDFELYIRKDAMFKKQHNRSVPSVYAICSEGNVSFYKYSNVKLPFL